MRRTVVLLAVLAALARAQSPDEMAKVAEAIDPASVAVEYRLRFDRGEAPRCLSSRGDEESLVKEERPLERAGLLVGDGLVLTTDPMVHPRFVERIDIRRGARVVTATPFRYLERGNGLVLKLDGPLEGTKPLSFAPKATPAYRARMHQRDGLWGVSVWRNSTVIVREEGKTFGYADVPLDFQVASDGAVVGIHVFDELPSDDSWKGSPLDLPAISADDMAKILEETATLAARCLPRVSLTLRSAKAKGGNRFAYFDRGQQGDDATEIHAVGVVLDEKRVLVLADLKPKVTARLEGILIHRPEGDPVPADFRFSLKRLAAFVAEARSPLPGPLTLPKEDIRGWRGKAIVAEEIVVTGEERTAYAYPARFDTLNRGFREQLDPSVPGDEEHLFLFDAKGTLLALPAQRRDVFAQQERWHRSDSASLLAAANLKDALLETDPANVPLTEEEENRVAWMGVVLQPLDEELAKENKISELTKGGDVGGLVAYVYPGSPAERAGLVAGDLILRIHAEGLPRPLDVKADDNPFADMPMDIPEEYLEQLGDLPPPWPPADSGLARMLTDLGAGRKYEAELVHEGKVVRKPFVVEMSPTHFDSAKRFKSDPLGLTVRDLTYEVRQHYQMGAEDAGVVVSKVEKGKKAAVAGVRIFEIVTQVDDKPVKTAEEFEKAVAAPGEHRFTLKFKSRTRVVKITAGE